MINQTLALRTRAILSATRSTSARGVLAGRSAGRQTVKRGFAEVPSAANKATQFNSRSEVDPSPSTGSNPTLQSASPSGNRSPRSEVDPSSSTGSNPILGSANPSGNGPPPPQGPYARTNQGLSGNSPPDLGSSPLDGSTPPPPPPPYPPGAEDPTVNKAPKLGPLFAALLMGGLALSAYGIGEVWGSMTVWPKELRWELRHGLLEFAKGEKAQAELYLSRAWNRARAMDIEKFGDNAYLKTSGIAIALAEMYESEGKQSKAYHVLTEALQHLQDESSSRSDANSKQRVDMEPASTAVDVVGETTSAPLRSNLSPAERMRAVAIAYKLSELAETLKVPKADEEKWLVYTVETVLKDVMNRGSVEVMVQEGDPKTGKTVSQHAEVFEQLELPRWVHNHDLAAPFEALGTFYAHTGKIEYAMPLYLQAIAILIPPPPQNSSSDDQCRAAQLMANISELIIRASTPPDSPNTPPPSVLSQAEGWASKAVEVASRVRKSTFTTHPACEVAYAFALFNLGIIKEISGDESRASEFFARALDHSRSIGFEEGIVNAKEAIRNVGKRAFGVASEASLELGDAVSGTRIGGARSKRRSAEDFD